MKWFLVLLLATNISLANDQAPSNNLGEAIGKLWKKSGFGDGIFSNNGECPAQFEHVDKELEDNIDLLISRAFYYRNDKKDRDYCESARYFSEIRRLWATPQYFQMAWKELIKSYILAGDLIEAINEGNEFIEHYAVSADTAKPQDPAVEEVHLILINAVHLKMAAAGSERSQEWTEYALGISKEQNSSNPYLKNLSYKDYLERYPNSKNKHVIEGMVREARNNYAQHQLNVGNYSKLRILPGVGYPNYPGAVGRYSIILGWGPIVSSYNQALYETVDALYKMAAMIESNALDERSLKDWLHIDPNVNKNLVDRKSIVTQIYAQIAELQRKMNASTVTQDDWIQKTRLLIQEKQK